MIASAANTPQLQINSIEMGFQLEKHGERPVSLEGYAQAEWILADSGDFLVHVFSEALDPRGKSMGSEQFAQNSGSIFHML